MPVASKPVQLTPFAAAFAGALGGCFSTAVVYPLDVAKTRIQAIPKQKGKPGLSVADVLIRIYTKEGLSGWYRGFAATMMNTFSTQYAYFFFYSFVRTSYIRRLTARLPPGSKLGPLSTATELLLGAVAGALAQLFTIPVSVIATRQQVGRPDNEKKDGKDSETFLNVGREIIERDGVAGLWLGLKASLVLTVNPAITYGMFERVKSVISLASKSGNKLSPGQTFLVGALSKTLATVVTYPYIMAKVRIQARTADVKEDELPSHGPHQTASKSPGAVDVLVNAWKKDGPLGWYQGMQSQIIKAVLSQALLFMSKDQFEQWTLALVVLLARLRLSS